MSASFIDIPSIRDLHLLYGCAPPRHPLITVLDLTKVDRSRIADGSSLYRLGLYTIFCKKSTGTLRYGQSYYDFNEGTLMFTGPHQVVSPSPDMRIEEGWGLFFHPHLLQGSALAKKIPHYSFFHYDAREALHVSDEEKRVITECAENIKKEYAQNIDKHTQGLVQSNLELLLSYCERFYDRQFFSRAVLNNDLVQRFERALDNYFSQEDLIGAGLPDVKYFAGQLNLSPNYLSDLLKRHTGKTTQEHIHLQLVERAKLLLWGSDRSISEIAYSLGFEHPSHFTRIFKNGTGKSPTAFRLPD
jgi:AraC family transcriptional activator of pobA